MCHHRDFRTERTRADDEAEEPEPTADPDHEPADDVEILTDGGDGEEDDAA
ncbi:hypothetical protein [Halobaculum sp. MBLA0143]|uniref:hypothetical protein n=1 Tax=Halobaculum sp. MBLA0143 TaxID=3079933 RepID=UPI003525A0B1